MLPISVFSVLAVTSSITSSSSPVDLFSTNHSSTSSSLDNSPANDQGDPHRQHRRKTRGEKEENSKNQLLAFDTSRENVRLAFLYIVFGGGGLDIVCEYLQREWGSGADSRRGRASCPGCTLRPGLCRGFLQNRCLADQPRRQCFPVLATPWRTVCTLACLRHCYFI